MDIIFLIAQWIEHLPGVQEVVCSIPDGDSDLFFFVLRLCHIDQLTFDVSLQCSIFYHTQVLLLRDKQN